MGKYSGLLKGFSDNVHYWSQIAMRRFVAQIAQRMDNQDLSRAQLAEKLDASPAYVTKILRGDVNFTLETMTKLAMAVGGKLRVDVADKDVKWSTPHWYRDTAVRLAPSTHTKVIQIASRTKRANVKSLPYKVGKAA